MKRGLTWGAVWVVFSALAFLLLYWVVALGLAIMGFIALIVALAAADWDDHSTFEEREQVRARKRKEKYERQAGARAKDRAIWEAHRPKDS